MCVYKPAQLEPPTPSNFPRPHLFHHPCCCSVPTIPASHMAHDSTVHPNSACNLPATTTEGSLHQSLLSLLDDASILNMPPSTLLALDELWPLEALPGLSTEFDFKNCMPNALDLEIPTTQTDIYAQLFPHHSPQPLPSPATSTDSCASFSFEQSFDNMFLALSPVGNSGTTLPSPATKGHDTSFTWASPPANGIAQPTHNITAHATASVISPSCATPSLACDAVVSPASASLVRSLAQAGLMGQQPLLSRGSPSLEQSWVSFTISRP